MEDRVWFTLKLLFLAAVVYVLLFQVLPLVKVEPMQAAWSVLLALLAWSLRVLRGVCNRTQKTD